MTPTSSKRRDTAPIDAPDAAISEPVSDDNQQPGSQPESQPDSQPYSPPGSSSSSEPSGPNMNATADANATQRARVLLDCRYGRCNTLVELDAEAIAQGVAERCLDAEPAAIAYLLDPPCLSSG